MILDKSSYILSVEDKKTIEFEGISEFIYRKLNSGKYRATKTTESYDQVVREKIDYCINNNLPLRIDLSTEAAKNPNLPTAPGLTVNFWSGTGVLLQKGHAYTPSIFGPKQYLECKNNLEREEANLFSDNSILSPKLSSVEIYRI